MSTRCQIAIYEKDFSDGENLSDVIKDGWKTLLYRHSDGYPGMIGDKGSSGVIPDILPFVEEFVKVRGYDVEYLGACLIAYLKYWHCGRKNIDKKDKYYSKNGHVIINGFEIDPLYYGISNNVHFDIKYFYAIMPTYIKVYEKSGGWREAPYIFKEIESHVIGSEVKL